MPIQLTIAQVPTYTGLLIGIWGVLTSLEWMAGHSLFSPGSVFDGKVLSLRSTRPQSRLLNIYLAERAMLVIFVARLIASIIVLSASQIASPRAAAISLTAAILLLTLSLLITRRSGYGGDGSDQMGTVVLIGYILMAWGHLSGSRLTSIAGIVLIAGQLTISYCVSGVSKWLSRTWRSGLALPGVMGTYTYGHSFAASVSEGNIKIARLLCWLIFVTETIFPASLLLPPLWLQLCLACFLFFHLSNAYFMGLNAFVWSFSACYPSLIFVNSAIAAAEWTAVLSGM